MYTACKVEKRQFSSTTTYILTTAVSQELKHPKKNRKKFISRRTEPLTWLIKLNTLYHSFDRHSPLTYTIGGSASSFL